MGSGFVTTLSFLVHEFGASQYKRLRSFKS